MERKKISEKGWTVIGMFFWALAASLIVQVVEYINAEHIPAGTRLVIFVITYQHFILMRRLPKTKK